MTAKPEPIAVIGSACRFAGDASSPSTLWDILRDPVDLQQEIPASRFDTSGFYHPDGSHHGHTNVRYAYLLNDSTQHPANFDAEFFKIKPVEAKAMDPQQRFLLEVVYEGLEAAGLDMMGPLRGSDTGVYVGVMFSDYATMLLRDYQHIPTYYATGTGQSILSNRISHFFDWRGPSLTIDTACSSSLVAVHLAVQALRSGECQVALACGTNLILGPEPFIIESKLNMLSPDGRGRMWDEAANGYARGDGVAAVVLKPLSAALRDGDHIECVIRETGVNQDGAGSAGSAGTGAAGITMPSAAAQEALIRSTYARAGLDLSKPQDRPQYFEAHGTGTPAGDPVEAEAIHRSFFTDQSGRDLEDGNLPRLYVGSIKTVVGHTEGTAGVAALIKTSLTLQQGVVPPNLLFEQLSKRVEPYYKNLRILQRSSEPWPEVACDIEGRMTRRASVNSFGFGGTNAHAILESYDQSSLHHPVNDNGDGQPLFTPFVFSASSEQSLRRTLSAFAEFLSPLGNTDNNVEKTARDAVPHKFSDKDLAWTLRKRRTILQYRIAITASSLGDLHSKLTAKLEDAESSKTLGAAAIAPHPGRRRGEGRGNKILGVFTGQGAQYARMGAELIERSVYARNIITQLQSYLDEIIREDKEYGRPHQWSLEVEIINGSSPSWVLDPTRAQPICTALQILLVDLLRLAGVQFSAVVGHSSGEIAAAYAAGYLSAPEAMRVSYYRGVCAARWAQSPNGHGVSIKGAMLAVGASMEDMAELCADEAFAGRVWVAASNSPSSVTLSGDEGAIEEIEAVLNDEDKFHRRLRVGGDMAYHSGHMASCYEPYVAAMRGMTGRAAACSTMPDTSVRPQCAWYSSVYDGQLVGEDMRAELKDKYWAENLTRPVMFSQAVNSAIAAADGDSPPFDAILEVGPHPALKRPTLETIKSHDLGTKDDDKPEVAYQGVLSRESDAIEALSTALGALWSCMDTKSQPNLDRYERAMAGIPSDSQNYYKLVNGLPTYRWDHSTKHWHESRISRKMRLRSQSPHPLLGEPTPDSSSLQHAIWRNLLRVSELEWLTGHAVQGQILFPAAGYLVSAFEAARLWMLERSLQTGSSPKNNDIRLLELRDFAIHHAIPLDEDDDAGVEVLIQLADITGTTDTSVIRGDIEVIEAKFKYSAALPGRGQADDLTLVASAQIIIEIGNSVPSLLPERAPRVPHTIDVEPERFYAALDDLGYNFSGQFRALTDLRRRKGKATCSIRRVVDMEEEHHHQLPFLIHPVELDAVLQSAILAHSYPYDEELRELHLPTTIQQIRINPSALLPMPTDQNVADSRIFFQVDASLAENFYHSRIGRGTDLVCNMDVFLTTPSIYSDTSSEPHAAIQVQGAEFRPIGGPSGGNGSHENRINLSQALAENDRCMYSRTRWIPEQPDGIQAAKGLWHSDADCKSESDRPESGSEGQLANLIERIALFYLRKFDREIGPDHPARTTFPTKYYLNYARHMLRQAEDGKHRWFKEDWRSDTAESILEISQPYMHMPDVEIMHLIGTQMPRVFAGHTTILEELRLGGNDLLDRYYVEGIGPGDMGRWTGRIVKQMTDRRPDLKILEVGAGTGSATKAILKKIGGHAFASYTYTDISPSFFENAAAVFAHHPGRDRMVFKTLDLEKDPAQQGFSEGAYDVVVAFCVLHATSDLERSLVHVRKLLKPGGYLVLSEVSDNGAATMGFIFGTFPGWWVGVDKGRVLSPLVSSKEWDMLLRRTGFSGVDTMPPSWVEDMFGMCAMISQAVDETVSFLRDPLCISGVSPENIPGNPPISNLVLVGGQNPEVTELVHEIQRVLIKSTDESPPLIAKVHRFDSLVSLMERRDSLGAEVLASSIVLSLVELDCPVFQGITSETFMALKSLLETAKHVLWVTSGRLCNEPYSNMTVAFGRVASYEFQDLSMQQLDIPQGRGQDMAGHIVEALLRFHSDLEHKNDTFEREIVIDDTGRRFVPRLFFLDELNRRYNAGRKDVVREADLAVKSDAPVALQPIFAQEDGGPVRYILQEQSRYKGDLEADCPGDQADEGSSSIELRLTHSIVSALKTPRSRSEFMVLGVPTDAWRSKQRGTGERVPGPKFLALVPSLASVIRVPMESVVPFDIPDSLDFGQALSATAAHLVSISVLDRRFCGDTMVVHNAQQVPHMADALGMQAAIKGVEILYTIDSDSANTWAEQEPLPDSWVRIPRYIGQSQLRQLLKMQGGFPSAFVGLSSDKTGGLKTTERSKVSEETMSLALRPQCETIMTTSSLFSPMATSSNIRHGSQSAQSNIRATLSRAVDCAMRQLNAQSGKSAARQDMALKDLLNQPSGVQSPLTVIDWSDTSSKLPVHLTRLDATPMFKANKTYWLVGMSGDLGIALADWMVEKGVKNLVITSRRPAIAPEWIATHKHDSGATVTILPCDVADQQALRTAHETIRATLPPIAGVIHGAMVLHDVSIHNMSFEQLTGVTGPKVNGSIYLDRIFGDSIELDFFVLTSSIISVIGNRGQANYAAANSFMASLAAQRRRRGLPTAVVHGGAIIGAGYMEREARRAWDKIAQNNFLLRLSEQDFVQSICEGIEACRRLDRRWSPSEEATDVGWDLDEELCTGLNFLPVGHPNPPLWVTDPKFSHFLVRESTDSAGKEPEENMKGQVTLARVSILDLLQKCGTIDETHQVVRHAFAAMLRNVLQVTLSDGDLMASRGSEIGLDSLVSVNIRSWFLKQLQVGIPVFKIMSNDYMESLVRLAIKGMPATLFAPQLQDHSTAVLSTAENEDKTSKIGRAEATATARGDSSESSAASSVVSGETLQTQTPSYSTTSSNWDRDSESLDAVPSSSASTGSYEPKAEEGCSINWDQETRPPADLLNIPLAANLAPPQTPPKVIVLTGATGLLGRNLVHYLLKHTSVQKIICIAVRSLSFPKNESSRVEYHTGDLTLPLLGLTPPSLAEYIFNCADAVIHNGADTSHLKRYDQVRGSNLGSTLTLARLCLPRRIPLHYVSSAGVALLSGMDPFPPVSVGDHAAPRLAKDGDGSFGYGYSKWVCERLLERTVEALSASGQREWKVVVHRPSTIVRTGQDAEDDPRAELDWVNAMFKYARKSGMTPVVQRNKGALDLVYVESVCQGLVEHLLRTDGGGDGVAYVNAVGDVVIPLDKLEEVEIAMGLEGARRLKPVRMDQWLAAAVADGVNPAVAALIEMIDEPHAIGSTYPRLLKSAAESDHDPSSSADR